MNVAILTIVVLYTIALAYNIKKRKKEDAQKEKEFWDREHEANFTRKKSIEDLSYINIPDEVTTIAQNIITFCESNISENDFCENDSPEKREMYTMVIAHARNIISLSSRKIVNLNGITNTELKLQYGAANITTLSDYDQNYSDLIVSLDKTGLFLHENDMKDQALTVLEYASSIHSDIYSTYDKLSQIYIDNNKRELIHLLIKNAEEINSIRKNAIIKHLQEKLDA